MEHNLVSNSDIESNFWQQNPAALTIPEFKEKYDQDKSKQKINSSKMMWCLFMLRDQTSLNKLRNMSVADKIAELTITYYDGDWKEIETLYSAYDKHVSSYVHKRLAFWKDQLEEREAYIRTLKYDIDTEADKKEKMLASMYKLWQDYERAERMVKKKKNKAGRRGRRSESDIVSGEVFFG